MDTNTQITAAQYATQLISNVTQSAAILSVTVGPVIYGILEVVKKIKIKGKSIPGWVAGFLAGPVGVLVVTLFQGAHFTLLGSLEGIYIGYSVAGLYSIASSATAKKQITPNVIGQDK